MRAIFLDRDGTLLLEPVDGVVDAPDKAFLFDDALEGLKILAGLDYTLFIVSNQIGLARKRMTVDTFNQIHRKFLELIAPSGVTITKTYICPHEPADNCECRKPKKGMITQALKDYPEIDLSESWVIGDRLTEVGLANAIGSRMVLIDKAGKYAPETAEFVVPSFLEAAHVIQTEEFQG